MKKSIKILSLIALISLAGCSGNSTSSSEVSSSIVVNSSLTNSEIQETLNTKIDATKSKLETVLKGEKIGVKVSASVNESMNIVVNGQNLADESFSESFDAIGNIDMKAGKEYYDEYLTRTYEDIYDEVNDIYIRVMKFNEEKVAEIAANDTSSYYFKINSSMSESNQSESMNQELWYTPTSMTLKADGQKETQSHNGSTNYMFYEYVTMVQSTISSLEEMTKENMPQVLQTIIGFFEGSVTSEEMLPILVQLFSLINGTEISIEDENQRQFLIDCLTAIQEINYESLYNISLETSGNNSTLIVRLNLDAVQANLLTFIQAVHNAYLKSAIKAGVDSESQDEINHLFSIIKSDIRNNLPSTFDVYSTMSFKNNIVTETNEVVKIDGKMPQIGLVMLGFDPNATSGTCTYSINMDSKTSLEFGNEYYVIPANA